MYFLKSVSSKSPVDFCAYQVIAGSEAKKGKDAHIGP
jgi:hypothetical protein